MSTLLLQDKTTPTDPLMRRFQELKAQRRQIDAELIDLTRKMQEGTCEVCGKLFRRLRPTKRYCSQRCNMKASIGKRRCYDIEAIARALPVIEAARLMTPGTIETLRVLVNLEGNTSAAADRTALSHQRVSQIAGRATKLAQFVETVRQHSISAESA